MRVFTRLLELLFPSRHSEVLVRESSIESLGMCAEPTLHIIDSTPCTSLLPYRVPQVRALILEAKFHEHARAHHVLGTLLREHLITLASEHAFSSRTFVLIPIPLSKKRMRERGHNQIQSIIKHALTPSLEGITSDTRIMRRVRDTTPQTNLRRVERLKNMRGAFQVTGAISTSVHYIIVDDVMTTGATLAAAAHALREAGATSIELLALAH